MGAAKSTTKDAQCVALPGGGCASPGFNKDTCTRYLTTCYSNTAPQCSAHSDCKVSWTGECVNSKGGSSLYCRHSGAFGACECFVDRLSARVWPAWSNSTTPFFPEQCTLPPSGSAMSLAYSGGGNRSFGAMIGYARFMQRVGYLNAPTYVSTVSGGSWFHGTYSFARAKGYTADQLLGMAARHPANITLSNLDTDNFVTNDNKNPFMGARTTSPNLAAFAISALLPLSMIKSTQAWAYAIGESYLEPYGLNADVPIALNAEHARSIELRNPRMTPAITPEPGSPFWLCNGTVFDRTAPTQFPLITFTPLYSGVMTLEQGFGGVWTETFAADASVPEQAAGVPKFAPQACASAALTVSMSTGNSVMSLKQILGTSSSAYTKVLFDSVPKAFPSMISPDNLTQQGMLWSPGSSAGKTVLFGDGAFSDNLGILALLQRGASRIVCFDNDGPLSALQPIPANCPLPGIMQLFGRSNGCDSINSAASDDVKVFDGTKYDDLVQQFAAARASKGPVFAYMTLPVLENKKYGVKGGFVVTLLIIRLERSLEFVAQLPASVQAELQPGKSLANFPQYNLILENPPFIQKLTPRQLNLLSSYTEWTLAHPAVQQVLTQVLGLGAQRYTCSSDFACVQAGRMGVYASQAECSAACVKGSYCDRFVSPPVCRYAQQGTMTDAECSSSCI